MSSSIQSNSSKGAAPTAVAKLRNALANPDEIIVAPGVYDGFTTRIALSAGFEFLYMTGAGTTMSRLGMPDLGVATFNDMRDSASMIASINPSVPLIADADTGYGEPLMVGRTVSQYMRAGVAALHLEDQVQTKRCGHLLGKQVVAEDEFISRIRAAVLAREREAGDIVIIARTDALQCLGYEEGRDRLRKAIAVGADVAFLEGIASAEQGRQICQDLAPTPVLFNCVIGGVSPELSVEEAKTLGFKMIIFPGLALYAVCEAVSNASAVLRDTGKAPLGKLPPKAVFEICGLKECMEFDLAAGGKLYSSGV